MSTDESVLRWLLEGDPSIRWQTRRDLLDADAATVDAERSRVAKVGWGARLLALQEPSGRWGGGLYSPKWTSTTYTMLLLHRLGLPDDHPQGTKACELLLEKGLHRDGGVNYSRSHEHSETCITGMVLSIVAPVVGADERVRGIADHLLRQQMGDGGWNCQSYRGATHSSFHTTICALEGLHEYEKRNLPNAGRVREAQARGREFLLVHRLFRAHRTGEVVKPAMTRFSFPPRWHYDVLRALDHFQACAAERDGRLAEAVELVEKRRRKDGRWPLQNRHSGRTHFELEEVGAPGRWNTLRALRVLRWWES